MGFRLPALGFRLPDRNRAAIPLIQFLCHSRGSLFEIETQLALAEQLGFSKPEDCNALQRETARIGQMINGLIRSVRPAASAA
ncbi:MAG: hypothetical protein DMG79_07315 [Acidobacteria bacterium]|nr:MAG: hypothetical protein DMG79_07315 [Acidobacteriota bacterium]